MLLLGELLAGAGTNPSKPNPFYLYMSSKSSVNTVDATEIILPKMELKKDPYQDF